MFVQEAAALKKRLDDAPEIGAVSDHSNTHFDQATMGKCGGR